MKKPKERAKTSKEVIEKNPNPQFEHSLLKFSGEEPINITKDASYRRTVRDDEKARYEWKKRNKRMYSLIHPHPTNIDNLGDSKETKLFSKEVFALPGAEDLLGFLRDDQQKAEMISSRNPETGEVWGYTVIKKTKKTPIYRGSPVKVPLSFLQYSLIWNPIRKAMGMNPYIYMDWRDKDNTKAKKLMRKRLNEYGASLKKAINDKNPEKYREAFDGVIQDFNLKYRFVPAKDYKLNPNRSAFIPEKALENRISAIIGILGLSAALFFLSSNLTGNVIGSLTQTSSNFIGGTLFLVGLIGAFFYFRKKK